MKWLELSAEVHPEAIDAVAEVFRRHGTGGVAIEQPVASHIEGEEDPRFLGLPVIKAYLPLNEEAASRERAIEQELWHLQAFDLSPVGDVRRTEIDEEDWAHGWKKHFQPLVIGRVVIKPSWRQWSDQRDQIVVELDPGMAFGTGLHPTTRLMIQALQRVVRRGQHVLDLGTGSGILAITAARLGARVVSLDISEVAVEVARANVVANGVADAVHVARGSIDAVRGDRYDVVLANIIASVLVELAPDLTRALHPGGTLLASGIIEERLDEVRSAFDSAGLLPGVEQSDADWWLIQAQRPA